VSIPARLPAAYEGAGIVQVGLLGFGQWGFGSEKSARESRFCEAVEKARADLEKPQKTPIYSIAC
jgi:hypothetical protein